MDANDIIWISSLANAPAEIEELCGLHFGFPSECWAGFDRTKWLVGLGLDGPASSESTLGSGWAFAFEPIDLANRPVGPSFPVVSVLTYLLLPDEINRFMEAGVMYFKIAFEGRVSTSAPPDSGVMYLKFHITKGRDPLHCKRYR